MRTYIMWLMVITVMVAVMVVSCGKQPSTGTITGQVTARTTGAPIPNAIVHERTLDKLRTRTDKDGMFRLEGVSLTEHPIHVSARGFRQTMKSFPAGARKEDESYVMNFVMDQDNRVKRK